MKNVTRLKRTAKKEGLKFYVGNLGQEQIINNLPEISISILEGIIRTKLDNTIQIPAKDGSLAVYVADIYFRNNGLSLDLTAKFDYKDLVHTSTLKRQKFLNNLD